VERHTKRHVTLRFGVRVDLHRDCVKGRCQDRAPTDWCRKHGFRQASRDVRPAAFLWNRIGPRRPTCKAEDIGKRPHAAGLPRPLPRRWRLWLAPLLGGSVLCLRESTASSIQRVTRAREPG